MTKCRIDLILIAACLFAGACRPDPGPSRYDMQEPFPHYDLGASLPGPDPYQPGQKRLSVNAFYEGNASDKIDIGTHLYVYENTVVLMDDGDRIEGFKSTRAIHGELTWWGFGVHWDTPHDLRPWTKLHASFRSKDAGFASFDISMDKANSDPTANAIPFSLHASSYGWSNDGEWHSLTIPLADFVAAGLDLSAVIAPFVLGDAAGTKGESIKVDDVYFTAD